jgi:Ca-activated chloride channel family protein
MGFLIRFFCFLPFFLLAQGKVHQGLWVQKNVINYGKVEQWISVVDSIKIQNTSNQKIFLLSQYYPQNFEIKFPKNALEPSEFAYIEIIYKPQKTGKFNHKLSFYHSVSNQPFTIQFTGEILSLDPFYELACPSFNSPPKDFSTQLKINVIDSITKQEIKGAQVEIWHRDIPTILKTNNLGEVQPKVNIGLHVIYVSNKNYKDKEIKLYLNPKVKEITIGLIPKKKEEILVVTPKQTPIETKLIEHENKKTIELETEGEILIGTTPLPSSSINVTNIPKSIDSLPLNSSYFKNNNLVFVLDISASMRGPDRLPYMKKVMIELLNEIRNDDKISIITYNDEVNVLFSNKSAKDINEMITVINQLEASGTTNGGNAVKNAYKLAKKLAIKNGNNQIIIFTDGGFNGLGRSETALQKLTAQQYKRNKISFSALTFGTNKYGKDVIENMVKSGKGNYKYVGIDEIENSILLDLIKQQSYIYNPI